MDVFMTVLESCKKGIMTDEVKLASLAENISANDLMKNIAKGRAIVLKSHKHNCRPVAIGTGTTIKINSNIGTSGPKNDVELELKKLDASIKYGADAVMDLSTGGDIDAMRHLILEKSSIPVGTVPVYQVITEGNVDTITEDDFLHGVYKHIEDGVDFITIHSGVTIESIQNIKKRIMGVVSRGGSFISKWMLYHKKQNPLLSRFDDIVEMAAKHECALSLGDAFRPGCLHDATDFSQIHELKMLGKLAKRAYKKNVQVMIEGPGHVPMNEIVKNVKLQKKYCNNAPFYVLGPLVSDIGAGYDHITGAIGGAIAANAGADFLCYLTPREHLGLPNLDDVIDGVIASKIAAHAADISHGIKSAIERDAKMAIARQCLDWEANVCFSIKWRQSPQHV